MLNSYHNRTLSDWLAWQETLHPVPMELGLDRISRVAARLGLTPVPFPVIEVAGTNGKGSCVALLESIYRQAGYRVGAYTSPHLLRYNERVRIDGREVSDEALIRAFHEIDRARRDDIRDDITLTYFEFGTLAAMLVFRRAGLDVAVLEVGLGGRLDAVNLFDADVALITAIGIDHVEWLGSDRASIGREKAGIFRAGRPAICGDPDPPASVEAHARAIGADWYCAGKDFTAHAVAHDTRWHWESRAGGRYRWLPMPALAGEHQLRNAGAVLMAVESVRESLPVSEAALGRGLAGVVLPGRFQVLSGEHGITRILDVAHNPQAAETLARVLRDRACDGRTLAVVAMLRDKDIEAVLRAMKTAVDGWHVAGLDAPRGARARVIAAALARVDASAGVRVASTVADAYHAALRATRPGDRVVVFGSFRAVGIVLHDSIRSGSHGLCVY